MSRMQYTMARGIDKNAIKRQGDGSIVLNAGAFKVGTYEHLGFEVPQLKAAWDATLVGELSRAEAEKMLPQFEGLALTKDHRWIEGLDARKEYSAGTVTKAAELAEIDGQTIGMTRVSITDPSAIALIESGKYNELSIGFSYKPVKTDREGVDFDITEVELNHLALVEKGRAGKTARLYNHAKGADMAKLTIAGTEYQVPAEVAQYAQDLEAANAELSKQKQAFEGKADALAAQIAGAKTVEARAKELATEHANFAAQLMKVGYTLAHAVGEYDKATIMREALTKAGHTVKDGATVEYMSAVIDFAKTEVKTNASLSAPMVQYGGFEQLAAETSANLRKQFITVSKG